MAIHDLDTIEDFYRELMASGTSTGSPAQFFVGAGINMADSSRDTTVWGRISDTVDLWFGDRLRQGACIHILLTQDIINGLDVVQLTEGWLRSQNLYSTVYALIIEKSLETYARWGRNGSEGCTKFALDYFREHRYLKGLGHPTRDGADYVMITKVLTEALFPVLGPAEKKDLTDYIRTFEATWQPQDAGTLSGATGQVDAYKPGRS